MFSFANRASPGGLAALTRELADDIINDAAISNAELQRIKAFAKKQLAKIPSELRE